MTRFSMLLLAGVAVGSMTPSKVFAQSPNAALSTIFPTEFVVEGCTEPVLLSGDIHSLFRMAFDRSGGFHLFFQSNPQGVTGVGLITGATYQGTGMSRQTHTFIDVPFTDTFISNFRIIGPGPDNNLQMHFNGHLTINANGEITASVDNFSSECG